MSEENNRALRNEILKTKSLVEKQQSTGMDAEGNVATHQPMLTNPISRLKESPQESGTGLEIELPAGDVPIPTSGLLYPEDHPLHNVNFISVRGITTSDEDILMNQALAKRNLTIDYLLKACILNKGIDVDSLLVGDKMTVLFYIRALGYGNYQAKIKCPKCEMEEEHEIDISNLELKELNLNNLQQVQEFKNEFSFVLPQTKKTVTFKFLTSKDSREASEFIESEKKKGRPVGLSTMKLINHVLSVDGITDKAKIIRFIRNMPGKDSLALSKHIEKNEPGIETKFEFQCKNDVCDHKEVMEIPMGVGFLWPSLVS